ncbi:MAG: NAD-dependent protein deacylase [Leptospiraceae bacterium]|nr:MAG: NAD-dependent protein deacylase [Leptospiraceae bacterium]
MNNLYKDIENQIVNIPDKIESIGIITGAGISQESGIPTFRGKDGLWKNYKPEELATPYAFEKNPKLVWEWYEMRRQIIKKAEPNPAHYTLVKMEEFFENFLLVTQNVDGLHEKAGSKNIIELHGNIWRARCILCNYKEFLETPLPEIPPHCPKCNSLMRPDVLWFGETYDTNLLNIVQDFFQKIGLLFVIGSSGQVSVPVYLAKEAHLNGAIVIEINPDFSMYSHFADIILRYKAAEALPILWQFLKEKWQN